MQENEEGKFKPSETRCARLWMHAYLGIDSVVLPCCMAKDLTSGTNTQTGESFKNPLNANGLKEVRRDMLSGVKNTTCSPCYENEKFGVKSLRQWSNEQFWQEEFVKETSEDGYLEKPCVRTLDIRLSNLCNFKCRSCGPEFSTSWYEDYNKLAGDSIYQKEISNSAVSAKSFLSELSKILPNISKIQFAGGEPLVIDQHYAILKKCIELKKTDLKISYHTNLSVLRFKENDTLELWKKFKKVQVSVSVDDLGARGEYLRSGMHWKNLVENMTLTKKACPNVELSVNVTVSIFNISYLDEVYDFFQKSGLIEMSEIYFTLLFEPKWLSIQVLPSHFKTRVRKKILTFFNNLSPNGDDLESRKSEISGILDYMEAQDCTHQLPTFFNKTLSVDDLRGESLEKTYPNLFKLHENELAP